MSQINVDIVNPQSATAVTVNGVNLSSPNSDPTNIAIACVPTSVAITSHNNTLIGGGAAGGLTTGYQNTVIGTYACQALTTGFNNTAVGMNPLFSNTTGSNNVAIGANALKLSTTSSNNTAIGVQAMENSVGNTQSVAIGNQALQAGAGFSVAVGNTSAANSTVGITAIGNKALQSSTGINNTAVGASAGLNVTTGTNTTLIGTGAGAGNTITGVGNTCLGSSAGGFVNSGNNNTCLGYLSQLSSSGASNEFVLGNSSVAVLLCAQTSITSISDARDKKEIKTLSAGLEFVNTLKPVEFIWDDRDENGRHNVPDFGFIAQDLKKSQEDAELADTLKLVYEANPDKLQASYGKLVPILVKAIQDLSKEIETLKSK